MWPSLWIVTLPGTVPSVAATPTTSSVVLIPATAMSAFAAAPSACTSVSPAPSIATALPSLSVVSRSPRLTAPPNSTSAIPAMATSTVSDFLDGAAARHADQRVEAVRALDGGAVIGIFLDVHQAARADGSPCHEGRPVSDLLHDSDPRQAALGADAVDGFDRSECFAAVRGFAHQRACLGSDRLVVDGRCFRPAAGIGPPESSW